MEIRVENEYAPEMKSCFVETERFEVAALLGLNHFVISRIGDGDLGDSYDELWLNHKEFNELYDMMTKMKELIKD